MKKSYLPYFMFILLFLGIKAPSFGNIVYEKIHLDSVAIKQTTATVRPPVEKKQVRKKRLRKARKKRYQLRHKPDHPHSPWPWMALAWTVVGTILLIIGLILGIYLLWFIAFIALVSVPAALFIAMIIALAI